MSLDVWLTSHKEMDCPHCLGTGKAEPETLFDANITHNLNKMADAAGIYTYLWRPEEMGVAKAGQLIQPLKEGLEILRSNPERFRPLSAPNGWGTYDQFLPWIEKYIAACEEYPEALVSVSR